ncbi:DegV family protein [Clostridium sp. JN-9]|uniref:DegV family protein n=1 Tax=Clostridium sp. JN-9 TaxID=2507159 RepID=UPI000FFE0F20|nr:DegV family protein [Clostridium sp. JN-9]QAT39092.1 DegV family protein [Clostridium sp. JN-9]
MTKIIVDSTCDLPEEILDKYNIEFLPLRILIKGVEYLDKKTIKIEQVYSAMKEGIVPRTSQPRPADIYNLFTEYCNKGMDFIYLSFSSALSGTYEVANGIAIEFKKKFKKVKIAVIDSKAGSTATGLIALQAAKLAEAGYDFNIITNEISELVKHVEHIFTIPNLNWLIKGGRISKTKGLIGSILDIKPILDVKDGEMEVIQKIRGRKKALNTVVDILEKRIEKFPDQVIGISHADDIETANELMEIINKRMGKHNFIVNKIGSVLGSHIGIGGVGVFFFNDKNKLYID